MKVSPSEVSFIQKGIEHNIRTDGRSRVDYRHFSLESGEIVHSNGSARLKLSDTEVLVGVKAEITQINKENNNASGNNINVNKRLIFNVDCCPSASPEFEGKGSEFLNIELAQQLDRLYSHPNVIVGLYNTNDNTKYDPPTATTTADDNENSNNSSLTIVPNKYYWTLYIDAIVLDSDGNLFDALSIATRAALFNTRLPKIKAIQGEYEEITFEVNDDPFDTLSIDIKNVPICVTMTKIASQFVIDTTTREELCMDARLTIGVNSSSNICSIQKGGISGLDPPTINQMINTAKVVGLKILSTMDQALLDIQLLK
ncbi:hypothetical protein CYY_010133 [Polysphondylium violaceum]|uniref:Ribosomal RNA-processing protein 42 n=1 Tax=Polysphondylium violaceum TaxID=133409 RepID=A0A8J4PL35_9MYCE|nr:hypothetical protein CYY_010133 [Polysphondylium violaceum]